MANAARGWLLCIDTGGTFTDCTATDPLGGIHRCKVLSNAALRATVTQCGRASLHFRSTWKVPCGFLEGASLARLGSGEYSARVIRHSGGRVGLDHKAGEWTTGETVEFRTMGSAPLLAAHLVTQTPLSSPLPLLQMRLATTRGTNALLERKTAAVAWITNHGFIDLLAIGSQQRPHLFARHITKLPPIHRTALGIAFRQNSDGSAEGSPDLAAIEMALPAWQSLGIESVAVSLIHSDLDPSHELEIEAFLRGKGVRFVSASARISPRIKLLDRATTSVANAALDPILADYLSEIEAEMPGKHLLIMTSTGALVPRSGFTPKDSLLSGPAGGVIGAARVGKQCGFHRLITFDMGGTSTDVSRFDGTFTYQFEHSVGDVHLMAPALRIETVAAGGGSICSFDGEKLTVGPESAGAFPGPACYGAGGPLTLTDVHMLAGRIDPARFSIPADFSASEHALGLQLVAVNAASAAPVSRRELLQGFLDLADEILAGAIRKISTAQGYDPADHALVAFGGAGGLHAGGIAARLGITTVLCPADAGVLSATGLAAADRAHLVERQWLRPFDAGALAGWVAEMEKEALARLGPDSIVTRRIFSVRLSGQEASMEIEPETIDSLPSEFKKAYLDCFGYEPPHGEDLEVVAVHVEAGTRQTGPEAEHFDAVKEHCMTAFANREALRPGDFFRGPVCVQDGFGSVFVPEGWLAVAGSRNTLRMDPAGIPQTGTGADAPTPALIREEIVAHQLADIVADAGNRLLRTALSTNVKERLDFSCALLDANGRLVLNAPHIPVHLGALGSCVRAVAAHLNFSEGDVVVTNHPGFGGSHLPDITVITPVFLGESTPACFLANRAHHAEIGGIRPGSMPPDATCLSQEGVVIPPTFLFRAGRPCYHLIEDLLCKAPYPSRSVPQNLADLRAQVAANRLAVRRITSLGLSSKSLSGHFARIAERTHAALLKQLPGIRESTAVQSLDDGTKIHAAITKSPGGLLIDFTGTSPVHPANWNATPAIVTSAVLYVLRLLVDGEIRLNEGLLEAVEIRLPRCLLNPDFEMPAERAPAVAAGNTETSQRLVDTLLLALGIAACSQGTMNNFLFGNASLGYYETICGGAGAVPGHPGASAVHTHMTNTAITDPEILERKFPVRLEQFSIRRNSGGAGAFAGGDGVVRQVRFTEACEVSLLTQHRVTPPYGMEGGKPGKRGRQQLLRADGSRTVLPNAVTFTAEPGDVLRIETPGGGGWGNPQTGRRST